MYLQSLARWPIFVHLVQKAVSSPNAELIAESFRQYGQLKRPSITCMLRGRVPSQAGHALMFRDWNWHWGHLFMSLSLRSPQAKCSTGP
jgi:hypothetical protein